ncbi:unnamed protein product [Peniophora sp. CBMAI 1063]|nr:unnamed protein product [Peniophora sp. CBMAI 1063]
MGGAGSMGRGGFIRSPTQGEVSNSSTMRRPLDVSFRRNSGMAAGLNPLAGHGNHRYEWKLLALIRVFLIVPLGQYHDDHRRCEALKDVLASSFNFETLADMPDTPNATTLPTHNAGTRNRAGIEALYKLSDIIADNVKKIDTTLTEKGLDFPALDSPFNPGLEQESYGLPGVLDGAAIIAAAAAQLRATVYPAPMTLVNTALLHNVSAALSIAAETHVAESLSSAGAQGLHVKELAKPSGIDPDKLSRVLRLLATYNFFREVAPDVFAHNRLSSLLDTRKPIQAILEKPEKKHDGTLGLAAAVGQLTDEGMKSTSYLTETVLDPVSGHANDITDLAFNRAFPDVKGTVWNFYDMEEQQYRRNRFAMTMEGSKHMSPAEAIVEGVDWTAPGPDALVVDVGGGVGAQSLTLSNKFQRLRFIVQDREQLITTDTKTFWQDANPDALKDGRVVLQAHDFFGPQPVKNADFFLIRMILHDYPDQDCLKILRNLRTAAKPSTQLIVVDNIMSYACDEPAANEIPGAAITPPPAPLLPNLGQANSTAYLMDVLMMALTGGTERTLTQVRTLLAEAGWKVTRVHHGAPFVLSHQKVIAVPA